MWYEARAVELISAGGFRGLDSRNSNNAGDA